MRIRPLQASRIQQTANGKRQTLDSNREFLKMENEQIKTTQEILMDKKCVKIVIYV